MNSRTSRNVSFNLIMGLLLFSHIATLNAQAGRIDGDSLVIGPDQMTKMETIGTLGEVVDNIRISDFHGVFSPCPLVDKWQ